MADPAAQLIDLQVQLHELRTQLVRDRDSGLLDIDLFDHAERAIIELSIRADHLLDGHDPTPETVDDRELEALLSEDG
ncbi:hypothetical protein [Jiangella alba]|uniref:Uncharacterized protein n=1 Tax=Jiangella alba TaxID=561176 RepID=A0A1H5MS49_9ACTN|nr:hypothetical protein [Jiangella alba]SEE91178.1 hypothetical protein SAMN04488561_3317 [Jiangella alba]